MATTSASQHNTSQRQVHSGSEPVTIIRYLSRPPSRPASSFASVFRRQAGWRLGSDIGMGGDESGFCVDGG